MFSAVHPITDIAKILRHVRFVQPKGDIGRKVSASRCSAFGHRLCSPVQSEVEDVEVAQAAGSGDRTIGRVQGTRQHERNRLLRQTAMRAQPVASETGEYV